MRCGLAMTPSAFVVFTANVLAPDPEFIMPSAVFRHVSGARVTKVSPAAPVPAPDFGFGPPEVESVVVSFALVVSPVILDEVDSPKKFSTVHITE